MLVSLHPIWVTLTGQGQRSMFTCYRMKIVSAMDAHYKIRMAITIMQTWILNY